LRPVSSALTVAWLLATASRGEVRDAIDPQPGIRTPLERLVEEPLPRVVCTGCLAFAISHRPWQESFADPIRDLFGYDEGFVRVRLDLRLGVREGFDLGATRTNGVGAEPYDSWSGDLRWARSWSPAPTERADVGIQAGGTWFEQEDAPDSWAPWGWAGAGFGIAPVWLGGGLEFHGNSSGPRKRDTDPSGTLAIHLETIVRLRDNLALAAETAKPIDGYGMRYPAWTFGPRWTTWRHVFSLWIGNARTGGPDGRLAGASLAFSPVLGFQLVREGTLWNAQGAP